MPERSKEVIDWSFNISGRRVDFSKGLPLAWGVEVDLPFDSEERERLHRIYKIEISQRVRHIKYLDLKPQESLPKKLRNIESAHPSSWMSELEKIAFLGTSKKDVLFKRRCIEQSFFSVFAKNFDQIHEFNKLIRQSRGDTILIAEGHGYEAPLHLGEQSPFDPMGFEYRFQRRGNTVYAKDILKKYNDPGVYSAIIFVACYNGLLKVKALDIPLAYGVGIISSENAKKGQIKTVVVSPRSKINLK